MNEGRKRTIRQALHRGRTLEEYREAFRQAEESSFLTGQNNRGWAAGFDWIIQEGNLTKILAGNYRNRTPPGSGPKAASGSGASGSHRVSPEAVEAMFRAAGKMA